MKIIITVMLIALGIAISIAFSYSNKITALNNENLILKSYTDSLITLNDSTVKKLTQQVFDEEDLRKLAEDQLRLTEQELAGTVRALTSVGIELKRLYALLESDSVIYIDTTSGFAVAIFVQTKKVFSGYNVMLMNTLQMPTRFIEAKDSLSIVSEIGVNFDPIVINIALTETSFGVWETYITADSPLFNNFGQISTAIYPKVPNFIDKMHIQLGAGTLQRPFLLAGVGYDTYTVSYLIAENTSGILIATRITLKSIFNLWRRGG